MKPITPPYSSCDISRLRKEGAGAWRYSMGPVQFLVLVAIASVFVCIRVWIQKFGLFEFDEPYQILNAMDYKNMPLAPLSNFIGGCFGDLYNWDWLPFRYLNLGFSVACIVISLTYFWVKTHRYDFLLALTVLLFTLGSVPARSYGWDMYAKPFLLLSMILVFSYLDSPTKLKIVVLGVLTAIVGLTRLPNFVMLPVIMLIIAVLPGSTGRQKAADIAIYGGLAILLSLAGLVLLYGSLGEYISYFKANAIADHSLFFIIDMLVTGVAIMLPLLCLQLVSYQAVSSISKRKINRKLLWCLYVAIFGCIYYNITDVKIMVNASMFIAIGAIFYYNRDNLKKPVTVKVLAYFLLACIPMVGSNTGIHKFLAYQTIPILAVFLLPYWKKSMTKFSIIMMVAVTIHSVKDIVKGEPNIWDPAYRSTYTLNCDHLEGMAVAPEHGALITGIYNDFKPYDDGRYKKIVLRSGHTYLYEYMFECRNSYARHDFKLSYDDPGYLAWLKAEIADATRPVAILYVGESGTLIYNYLSATYPAAVTTPTHAIFIAPAGATAPNTGAAAPAGVTAASVQSSSE